VSEGRVASDAARFGVAFASELMLTGRVIDASEGARIGLVNHLVAADALLERARAIENPTQVLASRAPGMAEAVRAFVAGGRA
jgi:enoyl-CoA hydratase/carnithine racemase